MFFDFAGDFPGKGVGLMSTYFEARTDPTLWRRIRSPQKKKTLAAVYGVLVVVFVLLAYLASLAGFLPADPDAMDLSAMNELPSARGMISADKSPRAPWRGMLVSSRVS